MSWAHHDMPVLQQLCPFLQNIIFFVQLYHKDPVYTNKFRSILGEIGSKKIDFGQV